MNWLELSLLAMTKGKASVVVPLAALYPAVTLVLAILILHEKINLLQGLGVVLAITSIILLST